MDQGTLLVGGVVALSAALAIVAAVLGSTRPSAPPALGLRGLKRHRALAGGGLFPLVEPVMRVFAGWTRFVPVDRRRADRLLMTAGDYLGLTAEELHALCVLSALVGAAAGLVVAGPTGAVAFAALGLAAPYFVVIEEIDRRRREIARGLAPTMEVIALCMGAGLDLPRSIEEILRGSEVDDDPLREELQLILHALKLGQTRRRVLRTFAERVDSAEVRDVVGAIIQGEERGTPIAEVLRIQAGMLRLRRGVRADKASSRAAMLMLIGPLVCLFLSILLLVVGPLVLRTMGDFSGM